jgi:WD40 repeat protein
MARVPGLDAVSGGLLARDEGIAILDGADPQVSVWNPSDGGVSTFDIARPGATVLDVALTAADGSVVVAWAEVEPEGPRAFAPLHVARYRPTDGEVVQSAVMDSLIVQELGSVGAQVELDPDGRHLLLTGGQGVFPAVPPSDSTIKLIEWTRQSQVAEYQWPVWDQGVPSVKFSPAGDAFLAHFRNSTFVFDNESGEFGVLEGSGQQGFLEFQFSPDSRYIAALNRPAIAGSRYTPRGELVDGMLVGGGIEIWHAETGDRLPTSSEGSVILDLAFAPDSRRMAMLDSEGNVRIQPLGIDALVDEAELRVTRPLSDDECRRFLHVERCQD